MLCNFCRIWFWNSDTLAKIYFKVFLLTIAWYDTYSFVSSSIFNILKRTQLFGVGQIHCKITWTFKKMFINCWIFAKYNPKLFDIAKYNLKTLYCKSSREAQCLQMTKASAHLPTLIPKLFTANFQEKANTWNLELEEKIKKTSSGVEEKIMQICCGKIALKLYPR